MTKNECLVKGNYKYAIEKYESTSKRWKKHWWDCLVELYSSCKEFAENYVLDNVKMIVEKITNTVKTVVRKINTVRKGRRSIYDDMIINYTDYDICSKAIRQKCYLFEFYDSDDVLLYSKVGTTEKNSIRGRLIDEIRSYRKSGYDIAKTVINRVWDCGDLPAEGLESLIRSEYIKKYPRSFKKNDRFINEYFDFDECDKIAKNYLEMA